MDSNLKQAFQRVIYHPDCRLSDDILLFILNKKRKNQRIKLYISSTIGTLSLIGLIPAIKLLLSGISSSGFYEYISLVFSDSMAITYWKEITLSIVESIPMTSLILSLTLIFVFVLSLRFIARNIYINTKLLTA